MSTVGEAMPLAGTRKIPVAPAWCCCDSETSPPPQKNQVPKMKDNEEALRMEKEGVGSEAPAKAQWRAEASWLWGLGVTSAQPDAE